MSEAPKRVLRRDYRPPDYAIDEVELHFDLGEDGTTVESRLQMRRRAGVPADAPLRLDGEELELLHVAVDGEPWSPHTVEGEQLVVRDLPERFELATRVRIHPETNRALSGLYRSSGNFCTQCEAMGFRRITWFLDRPDVMARYRTVIDADRERCPVVLSNGNRVREQDLGGGRHRVEWEDPFPKPSYLFALVAGDLRCHRGSFTTASGREVALEIWVEPQNVDKCEHALRSLQKAMRWDEEVFGLEYDLDVYMIVAVGDFNMGAMENKGLNIFNSKYVLANPEQATDDDYEAIEGVIAHEYFHNWTGNRVTCRDWFQLTLKEGLTVFRDQQFSADMTSAAVERIDDVRALRSAQLPEDAGPMAHPIRPESYISMDNFYTATVYEKGAEVVRMYHTLLGADGFRRGMDLYFERHDGDAVTCDDFRAAMADANDVDLDQFERWYSQAGTPLLEARGDYDAAARRYRLELRQSYPEAAVRANERPPEPLHVPVGVGLLGPDGEDLPLRLAGEERAAGGTRVLELRDPSAEFVFEDVPAPPVPSLLRDFSAPVRLRVESDRGALAFRMAHDADPFNRWDAGQALATELLLELSDEAAAGRPLRADPVFVEAFGAVLRDEQQDGSFRARALGLPSEKVLGEERGRIDVDALHAAREFLRRAVAEAHRDALLETYRRLDTGEPYRPDRDQVDRRRLKNAALAYLSVLAEPETAELVTRQFESADNMTDRQAALGLLVDLDGPEREAALGSFYEAWRHEPLVVDKWFAVQALCSLPDALDRVLALAEHPDFTLANPNRCRSLVGVFCAQNQVRFHGADGRGYRWLADVVCAVDADNPQLAARLATLFNAWRRLDPGRRALVRAELERIAGRDSLSKDVYEIVTRALGD